MYKKLARLKKLTPSLNNFRYQLTARGHIPTPSLRWVADIPDSSRNIRGENRCTAQTPSVCNRMAHSRDPSPCTSENQEMIQYLVSYYLQSESSKPNSSWVTRSSLQKVCDFQIHLHTTSNAKTIRTILSIIYTYTKVGVTNFSTQKSPPIKSLSSF